MEPPSAQPAPRVAPPDPRIGNVLQDRYRIISKIASGAMGVVYKGERVQLGRPVAVKFLHPWIAAQKAFLGRFENEARAMSRLAHPHCVSVIDFGVEGAPYLVMDYVTGRTLREVLQAEGRLAPSRALAIIRQLLAGLGHAHTQGIIHRDLKPENLILSDESGLDEHLRILDFGLAKLRDGPAMTAGMAVGTPSYMSPEQTGASGAVDSRTDLYAVGVLLFELLAGRKPFESQQIGDLILMHRETPPPHLRDVIPGARISAELEAVVLRAMAKLQEDRYQSAADFSAALDGTPEGRGQARAGAGAAAAAPAVTPPASRSPDATIVDTASAALRMADFASGKPVAATSLAAEAKKEAKKDKKGAQAAEPGKQKGGARALLRDPRALAAAAGVLTFVVIALALGLFRHRPAGDERAGVTGAASPAQASAEPGGTAPAGGAAAAAAPGAAAGPESARVAEARRLLHNGDWEQALALLHRARKEEPDNADVDYLLAMTCFENHRGAEGVEAAQLAVHKNPSLKGDADLINAAIGSLVSDKSYDRSQSFLRSLGGTATPFIKEAARHHPSPKVRQRAAELLQGGGGSRSGIFSSSRSSSYSSSSRSSSSGIFSR